MLILRSTSPSARGTRRILPVTDRTRARALAKESIERGDAVGWFERLYAEAGRGEAVVPWADLAPNPHAVAWLDCERPAPGRALDVGCGLGDTAEELARRSFDVVAFDVAPSAVAQARARFPKSRVDYRVADLLALPRDFAGAFDLVVECYTLQVLPPDARARAVEALRRTLRPGGTLLIVARGREPEEPPGQMPWPLTRAELEAIEAPALTLAGFEDFLDDENPPVRRLRAWFRRSHSSANATT